MSLSAEKSMAYHGSRITFIASGRENDGDWVVLLHGKRFTATNWQTSGLLDDLARAGFRVIALNLPGYGTSENLQNEISYSDFLAAALLQLGIDTFHLIGPSFSGEIALQYALQHGSHLKSMTLIASINVEQYQENLPGIETKTMIVWGTKDSVAPYENALVLQAKLPNNNLITFDDLGHTCYFDDMPKFREALLSHLK